MWMQRLRASFYVNYDFSAFPFDRQGLIMEFEPRAYHGVNPVVLVGSALKHERVPHGVDTLNGWTL